jgi:hypothetical protein
MVLPGLFASAAAAQKKQQGATGAQPHRSLNDRVVHRRILLLSSNHLIYSSSGTDI